MKPTHRVVSGLDRLQADGLACVACGANYLDVVVPHVPVGHSETGSQVFVCRNCPAEPITDGHSPCKPSPAAPDAECWLTGGAR